MSQQQQITPIVTGCADSNYLRSFYNDDNKNTWIFLQRTYIKTMKKKNSKKSYSSLRERDVGENAIQVPYEIKVGDQGRGLFVTEDVKEDTEIWSGYHHAVFPSERYFRRFMDKLPYELQCEILLWAYPKSATAAAVDLDEGSFVNHGNTEAERNMDAGGIATRDIVAGEQILMDYSSCIAYGVNTWFDEIRTMAWSPRTATTTTDEEEEASDEAVDQYNLLGNDDIGNKNKDDNDISDDILINICPYHFMAATTTEIDNICSIPWLN